MAHLMHWFAESDQRQISASFWGACCAPTAITRLIAILVLVNLFANPGNVTAQTRSPVDIPQTNLTPINPGNATGSSGFGIPNAPTPYDTAPRIRLGQGSLMDPYAMGPGTGTYQPAMPPGSMAPSGGGGLFSPGANPGVGAMPNYGAFPQTGVPPSSFGDPGTFGGSPTLVPSTTFGTGTGFANPVYPPSAYPSGSPSTLFPGGLFGGASGWFGGTNADGVSAFQLLHGPRLRHTFIGAASGPLDLQTNDSDVSIAFAFQNFLYSHQPLYVVPSFSLHLWDGPDGATGSDLPANAYSGFLDFGWQTDANQMFGVELGVRVGAFSSFDTFRSDSIRVLGKGLASFRLTPATTFKLGVYYLDRNKIKILPAGGLLWQKDPYTRFDIFFPQPKYAHYWRTIGTRDVWWYLGADYGGDNWTIKRDDGRSDQIDINDIRVFAGWEWGLSELIRAGRRSAFVEIGYVFDREVIYRANPQDNFEPGDGIMFRGGIGY